MRKQPLVRIQRGTSPAVRLLWRPPPDEGTVEEVRFLCLPRPGRVWKAQINARPRDVLQPCPSSYLLGEDPGHEGAERPEVRRKNTLV